MCKLSPVFKQFLTIACCNLLTLSFGLSNGWPTINYNDLQNQSTALPMGALNLQQASLVVSCINVGAFIGNFAIVPVSRWIGIKRTIHLLGAPIILSSLLVIFAKNAYFLYFSRLSAGFVGGALVVGIPTLINEISLDQVRGALNSLYDPSFNLGMIISFFLGNQLNCLDQAKIQLIAPVIFIVLLFFLPESPVFWDRQNKHKKAIKSLKFYKGSETRHENAKFLPKSLAEKIENGKLDTVDTDSDPDSTLPLIALKEFWTPHAKKAFFISFLSLMLSFLCATIPMVAYVTTIFTLTGSSLSEKNSSLLIAVTTLIANFVFLNIVERFNRTTLYIGSAVLTAASFFLFGAYCLLWLKQPGYEWMPPFIFSFIIFISCMGLMPVPYIITIEIFPKKIRELCLAIAVSMMWIVLFLLDIIFPIFLKEFGIFWCMITLGVICLLNAAFGAFFIPETRGKSYDEIEILLSGENGKHAK